MIQVLKCISLLCAIFSLYETFFLSLDLFTTAVAAISGWREEVVLLLSFLSFFFFFLFFCFLLLVPLLLVLLVLLLLLWGFDSATRSFVVFLFLFNDGGMSWEINFAKADNVDVIFKYWKNWTVLGVNWNSNYVLIIQKNNNYPSDVNVKTHKQAPLPWYRNWILQHTYQ